MTYRPIIGRALSRQTRRSEQSGRNANLYIDFPGGLCNCEEDSAASSKDGTSQRRRWFDLIDMVAEHFERIERAKSVNRLSFVIEQEKLLIPTRTLFQNLLPIL